MTNLGVPIIFINKNMSADRKRFTLAHELAHIIMHVFATVTFETDIEDEAFVFAAELLMPENEIYSSLRGQLNIAKLADLKRYWKVSMAAILYWAQKMKAITQNHARYLWTQFSALRIRHVEPVVIPNETPSFLFSMMNFFKENLHYTVEDLSTIFCLKVDELQQNYLPIEQKMRLVR
jgi:Zn-dependent peptidase ImmA (M78 family)